MSQSHPPAARMNGGDGHRDSTLYHARENGHICTASRYTEHHGLIRALIPFGYQEIHPLGAIDGIMEALDRMPKTAAMFAIKDIQGHLPGKRCQNSPFFGTLLRICGSYQTDLGGNRHQEWVNPKYIHQKELSPITDNEERLEHCREVASLGSVCGKDVAPRFGMEYGSFKTHCLRHDIPWQEWRQEGIARLARSMAVLAKWTDTPRREIGRRMPLKEKTACDMMHRHVTTPGWTVPNDPSGEYWFRNGYVSEAAEEMGL